MGTVRKLMVFGLVLVVAVAFETVWLSALEPRLATVLAGDQVNGGNDAFLRLRLFEAARWGVQVKVYRDPPRDGALTRVALQKTGGGRRRIGVPSARDPL